MHFPFVNKIFQENQSFAAFAKEVFTYQHQHNKIYKQWCDALRFNISNAQLPTSFPFLPISFFKTSKIVCEHKIYNMIFESSGTTQSVKSRHYVEDLNLYKSSFRKAFNLFYGDVKEWCVIGLLPSYLQQKSSSLINMVDDLVKSSCNEFSGFYLNEFDRLYESLQLLEKRKQKTLLIGVTYALLDFAQQFPITLKHTTVMETGGMKGRRKELTRSEVHNILKTQLSLKHIHSEYGMTELLSQAYSKKSGRFFCPPWMRVFVREEDDPFVIKATGNGALNIIDLANVYSCSFIATDDIGKVYEDGSFEVHGRLESSDLRGCSLMVV